MCLSETESALKVFGTSLYPRLSSTQTICRQNVGALWVPGPKTATEVPPQCEERKSLVLPDTIFVDVLRFGTLVQGAHAPACRRGRSCCDSGTLTFGFRAATEVDFRTNVRRVSQAPFHGGFPARSKWKCAKVQAEGLTALQLLTFGLSAASCHLTFPLHRQDAVLFSTARASTAQLEIVLFSLKSRGCCCRPLLCQSSEHGSRCRTDEAVVGCVDQRCSN